MKHTLRRMLSVSKTAVTTGLFAVMSVTAIVALSPVVLSQTAFAQDTTQQSGPGCAVKGFGEVSACPVGVGKGTNDCYVQDPADPKKAWNDVGAQPCDKYPEFANQSATVDCSKNDAVTQKYCDPANSCGKNASNAGTTTGTANGTDTTPTCDLVKKYIDPFIKLFSALVAIGVTISIIWGGIQYASSSGDPGRVSGAKKRILNAILTLIGYFLFYAFLNWIIPGGIG